MNKAISGHFRPQNLSLTVYCFARAFLADQGSQFTSDAFTGLLAEAGIKISVAGKCRWMDYVMVEHLWRSLKYECIYPHAFETGSDVRRGLKNWIELYNTRRPYSSLDDLTPDEA